MNKQNPSISLLILGVSEWVGWRHYIVHVHMFCQRWHQYAPYHGDRNLVSHYCAACNSRSKTVSELADVKFIAIEVEMMHLQSMADCEYLKRAQIIHALSASEICQRVFRATAVPPVVAPIPLVHVPSPRHPLTDHTLFATMINRVANKLMTCISTPWFH